MIRYTVPISPGRRGAQTISLTIPRPEVPLPPSVWQQRILQIMAGWKNPTKWSFIAGNIIEQLWLVEGKARLNIWHELILYRNQAQIEAPFSMRLTMNHNEPNIMGIKKLPHWWEYWRWFFSRWDFNSHHRQHDQHRSELMMRPTIQQLWCSKPWNPSHPWLAFLWRSDSAEKERTTGLLTCWQSWDDWTQLSSDSSAILNPCSYYRRIPASACFRTILSRVLLTISLVITHGSPLRFHIPVSLGCLWWNDWSPIPNSQICQLFTAELSIFHTFSIPQNRKSNSASSKHLRDGLSISVTCPQPDLAELRNVHRARHGPPPLDSRGPSSKAHICGACWVSNILPGIKSLCQAVAVF